MPKNIVASWKDLRALETIQLNFVKPLRRILSHSVISFYKGLFYVLQKKFDLGYEIPQKFKICNWKSILYSSTKTLVTLLNVQKFKTREREFWHYTACRKFQKFCWNKTIAIRDYGLTWHISTTEDKSWRLFVLTERFFDRLLICLHLRKKNWLAYECVYIKTNILKLR